MYALIYLALAGPALAGELLWDGRLNNYSDATFLGDWSWSNQIGPYQYYIHGSGTVDDYVELSADYKNPGDTSSTQGIKISIDDTSSWNGQNMMRTELIPQTTAAINTGKVFYHFSIQHTETDPPSQTEEHQVCFFESHFTELKYGLLSGEQGTSSNVLRWMANSQSHWNTTLEAGVWHNIAYGIDFDAGTVSFYHSTGGDDLAITAGPIIANTESNGADWHLGVLRLPGSPGNSEAGRESWHFSGVYIESGELTISIGGSDKNPTTPTSSAVSKNVSNARTTTSKYTATSAVQTTLQTKISQSTATATFSISTSSSIAPETPKTSEGECKIVYRYI